MSWAPKLTREQKAKILEIWEKPTSLNRPTYGEVGRQFGASACVVRHTVWDSNKINTKQVIRYGHASPIRVKKIEKCQWSAIVQRLDDQCASFVEVAKEFSASVELIRRVYFEWNHIRYMHESTANKALAWLRVSEKMSFDSN